MTTHVSVRDARANLAELLGRARTEHERFIVTNNGEPVGVLLGIGDFESMAETLDILSEPGTLAQILQAEQELAAGDFTEVTPGMTLADLRRIDETA